MKTYINDESYIRCDMGSDISTATVTQIKYKKPSGTTGVWTPTAYSATELEYKFTAAELDEVGVWKIQTYVEVADFKGLGETSSFTVYGEFE